MVDDSLETNFWDTLGTWTREASNQVYRETYALSLWFSDKLFPRTPRSGSCELCGANQLESYIS